MGIGKRELLEDYYPGELGAIVEAWNRQHGAKDDTSAAAEAVEPINFFGDGGEYLDD